MKSIHYIERSSGAEKEEKVYGGAAIRFLYGPAMISRWLGYSIAAMIASSPIISKIYGYIQKLWFTAGKIHSFVNQHDVHLDEFEVPADGFKSFNDFFIRRLKPGARPIAKSDVVMPADARYRFFTDVTRKTDFLVKGLHFKLDSLLNDEKLAEAFEGGELVLARLCPSDYHRYHFPVDCVPSASKSIPGKLHSVNPIATSKNPAIFWENHRRLTILENTPVGKIAYVEVGATFVGAIHNNYLPGTEYRKGDEKGYFSFGGSSLVILFEKGRLKIDEDLLKKAKETGLEIFCKMGESLGSIR